MTYKQRRSKSAHTAKPAARTSFPIVGVGASAGGLEAFTQLLRHLPTETGMGFVLVQHLGPAHPSALTQLLGKVTSIPVREVTNNLPVKPNHVYVIPPNADLTIVRGTLKLGRRRESGANRAIDIFLESLAEDRREQAIGVILSGTASDGTLGLEAIKASDGITFAQDDSAKYDAMPRSAAGAGCVDFVLSPQGIAQELARIAQHPYVAAGAPPALAAESGEDTETRGSPLSAGGRQHPDTEVQAVPGKPGDKEYKKVLLLLRSYSGVDFSLYKPNTIQRRITRRMVLNRITTLEAYANFLRGNTKELDLLYSDVLISVTSFFRNPEAFAVLQRKVFPKLVKSGREDPVRVWVLGCSTGQEAYSIAMAFIEFSERLAPSLRLQVFATDLNEALLDKARTGFYAKSIVHDVSPERLRRFFVEDEGGYRVSKTLREMVIFARQNVLGDPAFSRMDLVTCRNLMIYLEPSLQKEVLPIFYYSLKPEGFLFLGMSESIGGLTDLFEPVDKKLKIYAKKPGSTLRPPITRHLLSMPQNLPLAQPSSAPEGSPAELNAQREADRLTIKRYAPPGVLIDAELRILQFRGATSSYLEPPINKASFNVLNMARDGVMLPLRAAINKAKKENKAVRREDLRINQNGEVLMLNIEVIPLKNLKKRYYLVLFEPATTKPGARASAEEKDRPRQGRPAGKKQEPRRIAQLKDELVETRDYLQALQQQHDAAIEELQTMNEEVQSANEELQSINEELETSAEELESTNEELTTVNEEMVNRNVELVRLNTDTSNLHLSISMPILVLARDLTIRRFTLQAERIFNLLATDTGRALGGIRHNLECPDLEEFVAEVIDTVSVREREVRDKDGRWYILRARPYLTLDSKIDGAVLVLVDIDALKRSSMELKRARDYAEAVLRTTRDPLLVLRADLRIDTANEAFYRTLKTSAAEVEGRSLYELGNGAWNIPKLRGLLEDILPRNSFFNDFEVIHDFFVIGRRTMLLNARRLEDDSGEPEMILLSIEDVTERLESREAVRLSELRFRRLFEAAQDGIVIVDAVSRKITDANPLMEKLMGYGCEELIGKELWQIGLLENEPSSHAAFRELQQAGYIRYDDMALQTKTGERLDVDCVCNIYEENGHPVIQCNIRDISARKRAEEALRDNEERFRAIVDNVPVMIWMSGPDKLGTYFNKVWLDFTGRTKVQERGHHWGDGIHPNDLERCLAIYFQAFDASERFEMEYRLRRHDGEYRLILDVGIPCFMPVNRFTGYIGSCIDITERKQIELEFLKSSKLESIGVLAGGIAHDFNNLLTAIVGNLYLAKLALDPADDLFKHLMEAEHACLRARDLTQQLLTFSRGGAPIRKTIAIGALLQEWVSFALRGSNIECAFSVAPDLWPVEADEGQLSQVINNLVINGQQAMPEGGMITVTGENVTIGAEAGLPLEDGDYVRVSIRDRGVGIAKEHLSKIFDPFFTTKSKGSGLGLTTSYAIIQKHQGLLTVQSEPGVGTTFFIYLPASRKKVSLTPDTVNLPSRGNGKLLVMDDEAAIRSFIHEVLTAFGYEVECVEDGRQAVERYRLALEEEKPFDGVILDLTVPGGIGGKDVIQDLLKLDPKVKAIVSSGYSNDPIMADFHKHGFYGRIAKPYPVEELHKIALLLGKRD